MIHPPGDSPVVLYTREISPEPGCLSVSDNIVAVTGHQTTEFATDPTFWNRHIHPDDKLRVLDAVRMCARLGSASIDYRFLNKDGAYLWLHDSYSLINKDGEASGISGSWIDISRQKQFNEGFNGDGIGDRVTGLVNRKTFEQSLATLINNAAGSNSEHVLCFVDLDQFRVINNTCGHTAGNELLRQLGWYLQGKLRLSDTVAYLGGG